MSLARYWSSNADGAGLGDLDHLDVRGEHEGDLACLAGQPSHLEHGVDQTLVFCQLRSRRGKAM